MDADITIDYLATSLAGIAGHRIQATAEQRSAKYIFMFRHNLSNVDFFLKIDHIRYLKNVNTSDVLTREILFFSPV